MMTSYLHGSLVLAVIDSCLQVIFYPCNQLMYIFRIYAHPYWGSKGMISDEYNAKKSESMSMGSEKSQRSREAVVIVVVVVGP